jgi:hypothetical protein
MSKSLTNGHDPFAALALPVDMPRRVEILDAKTQQPYLDTEGLPGYIELVSMDSDRAQAQLRENTRKRQIRAQRNNGRDPTTPEEAEAELIELYTAITVGWHLVGPDGQVLNVECTRDNARTLYRDNRFLWVRRQVDQFCSNVANFIQPSSPT